MTELQEENKYVKHRRETEHKSLSREDYEKYLESHPYFRVYDTSARTRELHDAEMALWREQRDKGAVMINAVEKPEPKPVEVPKSKLPKCIVERKLRSAEVQKLIEYLAINGEEKTARGYVCWKLSYDYEGKIGGSVQRAFNFLIDEGLVVRSGSGTKVTYSLTDKGKELVSRQVNSYD